MLETKLHPLNSQHFSLDKEYRGQLVLRLKTGGRDEAVKIYDQICKETNHQTWYLKVCSFNMFIKMENIYTEHVPSYKDFKSININLTLLAVKMRENLHLRDNWPKTNFVQIDFKSMDQLDFNGCQNKRKLAFKRQLAKEKLCTYAVNYI